MRESALAPDRSIVIMMVMSDEHAQQQQFFGPDYYGEQDENGIDLSLIRENLKLTPLERIRKGDAARRQVLRLLEYGRRHREKSDQRTV